MTAPRLPVLALALALLPACGGDALPPEAGEVLQRFETALRAGDGAALRRAVTYASRPFVAQLPARPSGAAPLEILGWTRPHASRLEVRVHDSDPAAPAPDGTLILARESGAWRVDLIASAGANHREEWGEGPAQHLVPATLTPDQVREARRALDASHRQSR